MTRAIGSVGRDMPVEQVVRAPGFHQALLAERRCPECGGMFMPKRWTVQRCSPECRDVERKRRQDRQVVGYMQIKADRQQARASGG